MTWIKKHVIELMNLCALVGVIVSIFYAHTQLQEARRIAAVTSLITLKSDVTDSRRGVYKTLMDVHRKEGKFDDFLDTDLIAFRQNLIDHLLTIEYSCALYLNGVLDEDARRFLETVIAEDLEFLGDTGMYSFYENGKLVIQEDHTIRWVDPNGEPNPLYPRTLECAERLKVRIGR